MVVGGRYFVGSALFALSVTSCKPSRTAIQAVGSDGSIDRAVLVAPPHCKELHDRLCAQFGPDSEECRMAEERIKLFSADRCLSMLSRYDEMAKSAAQFVEGRKALVAPEQRTSHGPAPSIGHPGAPIGMVLFADFTSPDCARGAAIATVVRNLYQDKVRFVFRQFPIAGNQEAHLAAEAALAAHAQGKFWPFYDILFGNEHAHDRAALDRYAKAAGLNLREFDKALDKHEFSADVDADHDLGRKVNVSQVPALFVNGKHVSFPYGPAELADIVAATEKR